MPKCSYDLLCVVEFLDWSTLWVHCRGFGWNHIYTIWIVQTLFWFQFQLRSRPGLELKWAGLDYSAAWQTLDIVCVHCTKTNNLIILPILSSFMFHVRKSYRFVMKWWWDSDDIWLFFFFCLNYSYDTSPAPPCNVLWSTYLCISGSWLSEFSFSHICWGHYSMSMMWVTGSVVSSWRWTVPAWLQAGCSLRPLLWSLCPGAQHLVVTPSTQRLPGALCWSFNWALKPYNPRAL